MKKTEKKELERNEKNKMTESKEVKLERLNQRFIHIRHTTLLT